MSPAFRQAVAGPLATAAMAGSLWLLDRLGYSVPAPGALVLATVVYATWVGGLFAGYVSAGLFIAAALPAAIGHTHFVTLLASPGVMMEVVIAVALVAPLVTAGLRARATHLLDEERRTRARVEEASRELTILRAALDHVDYGVILLDEALRARFINRGSRKLWNTPDALAESRPSYRELMHNACDSGAFPLPAAQHAAYVERRVALVRAGDETPIDLQLANGSIVRFRCKALPAGGRFLSYTDVTDLVRHAEALERLATTDELTGICNRRRFLALAEQEWRRARAGGEPLALLIFDVDLFKSINDRFGHNVGDAVIRDAAAICHQVKRDGDIAARIGGEEFVLLLPRTPGHEALAIAEALRHRFEAAPFLADGERLRVTVSIGVAESDPGMAGVGDLMKRADQALYDAKRDGRNRVKSRFVPAAEGGARKTAAA
ncbi:MAG TPA: diguanylate cyclase [Xanthobacteraceae bacterium]|nr:diguanylate cyclase [Xanthobacteraceae bacterium]